MIGRMLNRYKVVDRLGKGGMGEVWVAEDTRLGRRVALKMLPTEFAEDRERLSLFEREARTVAALNHPHIVTLHDIEEADGQVFLVMELMTGSSLDALIPEGGFSEDRIFELAIPLAGAVAAAHEQGVVHRDLKPANIMLSEDGVLKVLDFGLAKQRTETAAGPAEQTATATTPGMVVGTAAYMSPEQAQAKPVDARSDIFSLGVILHEMSTGSRPFKGGSTVELLSSILRDPAPAMSAERPELPPRLGRIVARCLEKEPRKRFQSALDLSNELADLRHETSGSGVSGVEPVRRRRTEKIGRILGTVGLLLFIAVVTVIAVRTLRDRPSETPPPTIAEAATKPMIVVFPFENLGAAEDDYFAVGIADEISSRLSTFGDLAVISRTSATQYDRSGKTMAQIGEELGVSYVLEGTVRWAGTSDARRNVRVTPQLVEVARDAQLWSANYDETLDEIFVVQSNIAEQVITALDLTLGEGDREALRVRPTQNLEAYQAYLRAIDNSLRQYYSMDNRARTVAYLDRAVELDPDFALAWTMLSDEHSYIYHLRFDPTPARCAAAKRAVDRALELEPNLPEAHHALGTYHYRCFRDYDSAMPELLIASKGLPNAADVLYTIAAVQRRRGLWDEALENQKRALVLDPRNYTNYWDTGVTLLEMRHYDEALTYVDRALELNPELETAYWIRANVLMATGDCEGAIAALDSAPVPGVFSLWVKIEIDLCLDDFEGALRRAREFPDDMFGMMVALIPREMMEANALELLGRRDEARPLWDRARRILETEIETRPDDARAHASLGWVLANLGLKDEAIRAGERGVEFYPPAVDAFHGPFQEVALAEIYVRVGEYDRAFDLMQRLITIPGGIHRGALQADPAYDPLRDDPRFEALLQQIR